MTGVETWEILPQYIIGTITLQGFVLQDRPETQIKPEPMGVTRNPIDTRLPELNAAKTRTQ